MRDRGPDFLIIGAQRAGTTWLHRVLTQHRGLWLPPVKELHYFDKPDIRRTLFDANERRRVGLRGLASLDPWFLNFWLRRRTLRWYERLFRPGHAGGLLTGEITPAYAVLGETDLARIRAMRPDIKLVFIMRDPIDRAWSAVNNAVKKGDIEVTTAEKAVKRARLPGNVARSTYTETIRRLETLFPASQIYYCFFDDLRDRPNALLAELFAFLGGASADFAELTLPRAVNVAAGSKPIPALFLREIASDYLPMVEALCRRFEGPPHTWRQRYREILQAEGPLAPPSPTAYGP